MAIDEVKKFIAEQDLVAEHRYVPEVVTPTRTGGFDDKIAVIGAGPAGLSCAFYLAEKGYKPVIFEKNARPGGMLTYGIPSYKLEKDVIEAEVDIIREMGVDIRLGVEVGRDVTLDELREQGFKAFYVAIGCQGGRLPGIPGEDAEGVSVAVDFPAPCGRAAMRRRQGRADVRPHHRGGRRQRGHRCGSHRSALGFRARGDVLPGELRGHAGQHRGSCRGQ